MTPSDGISFLPLLKGGGIERQKPLFWEWGKGKAVRDGDWKLVAYNNTWELYNLKDDPIESKDLSEVNLEKFSELMMKYEDWSVEVGINNK